MARWNLSGKKRRSRLRLLFIGSFVAVSVWMVWWRSLRTTSLLGKGTRRTLARPVAAFRNPWGARPLLLAACLFTVLQFHGFAATSTMLSARPALLPRIHDSGRIGIAFSAAHLSATLSSVRAHVLHTSDSTASPPALQPPAPVPAPQPPSAPVAAPTQAPVAAVAATGSATGVISGIATWYGGVDGFDNGDGMADGTPFNPDDATIAASNHWPLGTRLLVCHGANCITVCVRDRGAFRHALDLSRAAFSCLAPLSRGVIGVTIQVVP